MKAFADTGMAGALRGTFGTRLTVGESTEDGRVIVEVRGHSAEVVAAELAGWADHLEVIAPDSVRRHLALLGKLLTERYGPRP